MDSLKLEILTKLSDSISKWLDVLPWYISDLILRYQKFVYFTYWSALFFTLSLFIFFIYRIVVLSNKDDVDSAFSIFFYLFGCLFLLWLIIDFIYQIIRIHFVPEAFLLGL